MKIFIGADHGAKELKEYLIENLRKENHVVTDCFIKNESETDDYPDTAYLVCKSVMNTKDSVGIVLCKYGIGMSIAANKYKGIRCARILNKNDAFKSRSHSDANVIAMGSENGLNYPETLELVNIYLNSERPTEERRIRRINKIMQIESGEYREL